VHASRCSPRAGLFGGCAGAEHGGALAWAPSFLWSALTQIDSPPSATLLGGDAAVTAAISRPAPGASSGMKHVADPVALLAEAPGPAGRQLTALLDAGVLRYAPRRRSNWEWCGVGSGVGWVSGGGMGLVHLSMGGARARGQPADGAAGRGRAAVRRLIHSPS
jgi:hypothetical protein